MNTLTDYRRPREDFRAEATRSAWRGLGGWTLRDDGSVSRVYVNLHRRSVARRALIYRDGGVWQWRVEEFDRKNKRVRRIANRNLRGTWYVSAAAAIPWADVAARISD
jgi:hypothetical protein